MPKQNTVNGYLEKLDSKTSIMLERLREAIKSSAPDAEEVTSYGIPMYKYSGHLAAFKAGNNFCSFVTMSYDVLKSLKKELEGFEVSGTTIHFTTAKPLPSSLVKKIIKVRLKENEAKAKGKLKKK